MNKTIYSLVFVLTIALGSNSVVNAACVDKGQNLSSNNVKSLYKCETGELSIYGKNILGNLGAGHNKEISKDKAINVNKKIGNKKIIDYFIGSSATYVMTNDNKVYVSGSGVADSLKGKRNTFIDMVFYKASKTKMTSISASNSFNADTKGKNYENYSIKFNTNSKYISFNFDSDNEEGDITLSSKMKQSADISSKSIDDMYLYNSYAEFMPIRVEKKNNGNIDKTVIDRKHKIVQKYTYQKKNKIKTQKDYSKGVIFRKVIANNNKETIYGYKKGKLSTKRRLYYNSKHAMDTRIKYSNSRITSKVIVYYKKGEMSFEEYKKYSYKYNKKGEVIERKIYKINKNDKFKLSNKKWYKYRKSGKNYNYITYYKNGKAKKTYKYELNKKGKVVSKKLVKLRK